MRTRIPIEAVLFYLVFIVFVIGAGLRAWFADFSELYFASFSDHFINAVTAKNIAYGLGWSSSGYETYPLNPENLTSGPTIILPVAFSVFCFGNALNVPAITMLILNLALFGWALHALRLIITQKEPYFLSIFLITIAFTFLKSWYWYRMLGEIPALLLLLTTISYLYIYLKTRSLRHLFYGGIAGTLAMGTKELTLLPLLSLSLVLLLQQPHPNATGLRRYNWLHTLIFVSLCWIIPLLFSTYQYLVLQSLDSSWLASYHAYDQAIHDRLSGISTLKQYIYGDIPLFEALKNTFTSAIWTGGTLFHKSYLGLHGVLWWIAAGVIAIFGYLILPMHTKKYRSLSMLLGVASAPLLIWFYGISDYAYPRHLYIGILLVILSIIFFIVSIKPRKIRYLLALIITIALGITGDKASRKLLMVLPLEPQGLTLAIQATQNYIRKQPPQSLAWVGMIDNNEFEYLAPRPNNFINALDLIAESVRFDEAAYLAIYPDIAKEVAEGRYQSGFAQYISRENKTPRSAPVTIIRPIDFLWLHSKADVAKFHAPAAVMSHGRMCPEIIFQNKYYLVEHCTNDDIQQLITAHGGLFFRPRIWIPHMSFPALRSEPL